MDEPQIFPADLPQRVSDGKDEMNLAEFPLSSLSDRLPEGQNTFVFEDRVWDESRHEMIPRQLTITGSAEHGLPTARDDEVLLGLIQLSKCQDFASQTVSFSRYQLIRLLGWRDESQSYHRIETSLNRWVGVTLYYKNAWWNKKDGRWANEKFHILDNVRLFDRDQAKNGQGALPISLFKWNDVVFRSFRAGNVKSLDFEFYKRLKSAVAKRLYRFLDKRFYLRRHWEFDLKELAWVHVGVSRSYDTANLKRKLKVGIQELEALGFLAQMEDTQRFLKSAAGDWRIVFSKAGPKRKEEPGAKPPSSGDDSLINALTIRGVTPFAASELISRYPSDRIKAQLEVFDWLIDQKDPKVSKNPAGFLVVSIKSEFAPPKTFVAREEQESRIQKAAERKRKAEERARRLEQEARNRETARDEAISQFWNSLSPDERARQEDEALKQAPPFQRNLLDGTGPGAVAARKLILDAFALQMLQGGVS